MGLFEPPLLYLHTSKMTQPDDHRKNRRSVTLMGPVREWSERPFLGRFSVYWLALTYERGFWDAVRALLPRKAISRTELGVVRPLLEQTGSERSVDCGQSQ